MPAVAHRYFNILHQTLSEQYQPCNCESCKNVRLNLANNPKKKNNFKNVLKTAEKAFKKLFKEKKYKPEQLFEIDEYKELVKATAETFNQAIPHEVSNELRSYLEQDVFVFSGLKTHTQLTEARSYLKNKDGITPYHEFEQKVLKLNKKYNRHYLEAEYEFAVQSAQSADQWNSLEENDERYWLQYRTAKDDRVRVSHQALHGTTLPKTDPFWDEFYPPNGWRCRCVAVEVRSTDRQVSNSVEAIEKGRVATSQINKNGKNKLAMFRFNPGKTKKVFPPKNSYSKVIGADKVKKEIEKNETVKYKKISTKQLKEMYKNQKMNSKNERIVNSYETGYIATANSFVINEELRMYGKTLTNEGKITVRALDELIKNNKLKDNITLHRNDDFRFTQAHFGLEMSDIMKGRKHILKKIKEVNKTEIIDDAFLSTSAIKGANVFLSRPIYREIRVRKGTNAFVTDNYSESEIILGRKQKLKIINIEEYGEKGIKFILETH